jgi:hypothetical protein
MPIQRTDYIPLVTVAGAQGAGDALTSLFVVPSIARQGKIMTIAIIDLGRTTWINTSVYLSKHTFTASAINDPFDPSDTDILNTIGVFLVDTAHAFADSMIGIEDNIQHAYWAPEGKMYGQLITRGTPTPAGVADMFISLGIEY